MNRRNSPLWLIFSLLLTLTLGALPLATTQAKKPTARARDKRARTTQPAKLPGTISGADKPEAVPDNVAWELFLRTVGENNARQLVERAGFSEAQDYNSIDRVMSYAKSLNETLDSYDHQARSLKDAKNKRFGFRVESDPLLKTQLARIQSAKDQRVAQVMENLPNGFSKEDWQKLQDFINTRVKRNIQIIPSITLKEAKARQAGKTKTNALALAQTSTQQAHAQGGGGNLYLYSDSWNDLLNVFGSGTISEQYSSSGSYLVTVTVTSHSGRSNTTQNDWSYATSDNTTGLSVGVEDGNYTTQAQFEQQDGYYDEYGNFIGTGSYSVGSSTNSFFLAPIITLVSATVTPSSFIQQRGNPPNASGTGKVSAQITATESVPANTTVEFDFAELTVNGVHPNPGNVSYTVLPGESSGYPPVPPGTRRLRRKVENSGAITTLEDMFTVSISSNNAGTVTNQLRINRIIAVPSPSPGSAGGVLGENSQVPAVFNVLPPPPPSPTPFPPPPPPPGCVEQRTSWLDKAAKDGTPFNIRSGCDCVDFDPLEAWACNASGGTWDWTSCFCGASPIVLDIDGDGYDLTNVQNGVRFDITGRGNSIQTAWTAADSDDAWLVLDRNQNNRIDNATELFGNNSEQPEGQNPRQGFASLGMYDQTGRGGNGDGKITRHDYIFRKLRLWQDRNHNGVAEPEELSRLPALDVVAIFLDYRESRKIDKNGNRFKYRAKIRDRANARVGRWAWDVFLVITPS